MAIACALAGIAAPGAGLAAQDRVDAAFAKFWAARTVPEAEKAAAEIVKSGVEFDDAWSRFKRGRTYADTVPVGPVHLMRRTVVGDFGYTVEVPGTYDPTRRYQVRVQLHGGVMGRDTAEPRGAGTIGALAGAEQIYVIPTAWRDAPWWSITQEENLDAILDSVRRTYNVDENRVVLAGVSDGATATFYLGMRQTTPFASFQSLNGNVMVLTNPNLEFGDLSPNNLLNKPFFIVNGAMDPLYPAAAVAPYYEHLKNHGVDVSYVLQPTGVHNTAWWPWVKDAFEEFVREHPRNPYPDRLTWETDRVDVHNRAHWLIIDKLRASGADAPLPDVNEFSRELVMTFGIVGDGTRVSLIQPGSNADRLGLRPGDVLTAINDRETPGGGELRDALSRLRPGDKLKVGLARTSTRRAELQGVYQPQNLPAITMMPRTGPSGRVDLVRTGNLVDAQTRGVAAFTLLLSHHVFDFSQPVKVVVNGRVAFDGRVERSLATLVKWAARDNDRTMLFGAELHIQAN